MANTKSKAAKKPTTKAPVKKEVVATETSTVVETVQPKSVV